MGTLNASFGIADNNDYNAVGGQNSRINRIKNVAIVVLTVVVVSLAIALALTATSRLLVKWN